LFRKEQVDRELDEEHRAVRLERGSLGVAKEVVRSAGWESFVDTLWQDSGFAGQ